MLQELVTDQLEWPTVSLMLQVISHRVQWAMVVSNAQEEEVLKIAEVQQEDMNKDLAIEICMIQIEEEEEVQAWIVILKVVHETWTVDAISPIESVTTFLDHLTEPEMVAIEVATEAETEEAVEAGTVEETRTVEERVKQTTTEMRVHQQRHLRQRQDPRLIQHLDLKVTRYLFPVLEKILQKLRLLNTSDKSELSRKTNVPVNRRFTCTWTRKLVNLKENVQ